MVQKFSHFVPPYRGLSEIKKTFNEFKRSGDSSNNYRILSVTKILWLLSRDIPLPPKDTIDVYWKTEPDFFSNIVSVFRIGEEKTILEWQGLALFTHATDI